MLFWWILVLYLALKYADIMLISKLKMKGSHTGNFLFLSFYLKKKKKKYLIFSYPFNLWDFVLEELCRNFLYLIIDFPYKIWMVYFEDGFSF